MRKPADSHGVDDKTLNAYPAELEQFLSGIDLHPKIISPDKAKHQTTWRKLIIAMITLPPSTKQLVHAFHLKWIEKHHFLRELIEDDDLLTDMMWVWLPRYNGLPLVLFRGENVDRLESGRIGTAWTEKEETAKMFARGLNAVGKGGVTLKIKAPIEAIVTGPSDHSVRLGENEYSVDIRHIDAIEEVCRFPPSACI